MAGVENTGGWDEDEEFFEEDEPVEKIVAVFEVGDRFVTAAPAVSIETFGLAGVPLTGSPHVAVKVTAAEVPTAVQPRLVDSAA